MSAGVGVGMSVDMHVRIKLSKGQVDILKFSGCDPFKGKERVSWILADTSF